MNSTEGTSRTFTYTSRLGMAYPVVVTLAQDPDTGKYDGMGQAFEGDPDNSAYVGNAVTIPSFEASSFEHAFEIGLNRVGEYLEAGLLHTPGVLGRVGSHIPDR